jgi:tetratricopeptide (TPR) repeat protein
MIGAMNFRSFLLVSTGAVLLAAGAAVAGAKDTSKPPEIALVEAAYRQLTAGRSADAIASYTKAIESQKLPSELVANALLNRALANQNLGRHGKAIDDYSAAMGSDAMPPPLRAVVYYNRGLSQQKLERLALAIEDFTSALLLDPELAQAYLSRASVLRQSGQYLFALGDYEKALRYSHGEPHLVLYGQALTYEALSRPLLAQNALARAIKVSPDFQPARDKLLALAGPEAVDLAADGGFAMLDDSQRASLARQREELLTASLSGARPDVTAVPTELPAAVEPPQALVEREADAPRREARARQARTATDEPRIEPTGETTEVAALAQPGSRGRAAGPHAAGRLDGAAVVAAQRGFGLDGLGSAVTATQRTAGRARRGGGARRTGRQGRILPAADSPPAKPQRSPEPVLAPQGARYRLLLRPRRRLGSPPP